MHESCRKVNATLVQLMVHWCFFGPTDVLHKQHPGTMSEDTERVGFVRRACGSCKNKYDTYSFKVIRYLDMDVDSYFCVERVDRSIFSVAFTLLFVSILLSSMDAPA